MTGRCWMCGRPRGPSPDGLGSHCRRKLATHRTTTDRPAVWPGHTQPALEDLTVTDQTPATTPADDTAMQALSDAGAICGECGDEPGDRTCPDCERCYRDYVAALRKAGWAPRTEPLLQAVSVARTRADAAEVLGNSRGARVANWLAERLQDMAREARPTA